MGHPEHADVEKCPKCASEDWGSVNWKHGKPYTYCPECGHTEPDPNEQDAPENEKGPANP